MCFCSCISNCVQNTHSTRKVRTFLGGEDTWLVQMSALEVEVNIGLGLVGMGVMGLG